MSIKDFVRDALIEETFLVEKSSEAQTKNGKTYLSLTLQDKTGSIHAKLWEYSPQHHGFLKEGVVVDVVAKVDVYNGMMQLILQEASVSEASVESVAKAARFDSHEYWLELVSILESMTEPMTRYVTQGIVNADIAAFNKAPAAKRVHNAYYGGLLEHVVSLCRLAEPMIAHYKRYQPKLSRDKVLFGLICHDAGKIIEYDFKTPAFSLTPVGLLTPHIVLGPSWVYELCSRYAEENAIEAEGYLMERAHLMHILAAHHGRFDWGSPVVPATLEALLVHHLDNTDAKMMHAIELIEGKPGEVAGFSDRSFFEKTPFMVPK